MPDWVEQGSSESLVLDYNAARTSHAQMDARDKMREMWASIAHGLGSRKPETVIVPNNKISPHNDRASGLQGEKVPLLRCLLAASPVSLGVDDEDTGVLVSPEVGAAPHGDLVGADAPGLERFPHLPDDLLRSRVGC